MNGLLLVIAMLICAMCTTQLRAGQPHEFEGVWVWDRAQYVPPPGMPAMTHMTEETMSVSRDDGARYTAQIRQVFDDGSVVELDEDFAEDGHDHAIGIDTPLLRVSIEAMPDGGRHVVSGRDGEKHDSRCHVSEAGRTLTCEGTHTAPNGSSGDYICVYHRDPHVIPLADIRAWHAGTVG